MASASALLACGASMSSFAVSCTCAADLSVDGQVDGTDLAVVLGAWGTANPVADVSGDGLVNGADIAIILGNWGPCEIPANDMCASAPLVGPGSYPFCNVLATTDGPAMDPGDCSNLATSVSNDLWYAFDVVSDGVLTVETCGTANFDTVVAVYASLVDGQQKCPSDGLLATILLGCNDDTIGCSGLGSKLSIDVWQGARLKIRVGGFSVSEVGSGTLKISFEAQGGSCTNAIDANDFFNPISISGNTGDNAVAALPGTCFNGQPQGPAEWINYTSQCWETLTITTCHPDTDFDTVVTVLRYDNGAGCWTSLEACNDDSPEPGCQLNGVNRKSWLEVDCQPGDNFRIVVSGYNGASGNYRLKIFTDCPW